MLLLDIEIRVYFVLLCSIVKLTEMATIQKCHAIQRNAAGRVPASVMNVADWYMRKSAMNERCHKTMK